MAYIERKCDCCQKEYMADERNLKRGWGLTCSKSCAASKREQSKSTYDPKRVAFNNYRRENWNSNTLDKGFGDKSFVDGVEGEKFKGRTSEGYRIFGNTAYDEWGEPIYDVDLIDEDDRGWDSHK